MFPFLSHDECRNLYGLYIDFFACINLNTKKDLVGLICGSTKFDRNIIVKVFTSVSMGQVGALSRIKCLNNTSLHA